MDINQLSSLVRDRILSSDEVIVPGLGTFRAEVVPASFSDKGFTVNPPYRKLTFTAQTSDQAGEEGAIQAEGLGEFVAKLQKELQETRCVELPGLGKLRLTKSDQYFFVPDEDANIYPDGFGLEPVSLKNKDARSESGATEGPAGAKKAGAKRWKLFKSQKAEPRKPKAPKEKKPRNPKRTAIIVATIILDIILIAIVALKVLGAVAPDFLDEILYSEEELAIIHNSL